MIAHVIVQRIVSLALEEDLGGGDLTTEATVAADRQARAAAVARTSLVVCGGQVFRETFRQLDVSLAFESHKQDGESARAGETLWTVSGSARSILMGERTALNLVQRMSGIATEAARYVAEVPAGCSLRIADTRKTTPGLRALERYAVRCGGAHNHRDNLGSAVMIKDNHIVAAGGITTAITRARERAPHTCKVEVEVDTLEQVDEALAAGADIIMLDNFAPEALTTAVARIAGRAIVEASGGITLARIAELAKAGVDIVSVGALTHSTPAADIGLDIDATPASS